MSNFDVAIIETEKHKKEDIQRLKSSGTWVIGYISLGEEDVLSKGNGKGPGGFASYYMDKNKDGKPDRNQNWNSWYADAGNNEWREIIIARKMKTVIQEKACDGVFMDTIDTVDLFPETISGMHGLIHEMKKAYPEVKLVANRGFTLLPKIFTDIDGLMFESFTSGYDFKKREYLPHSESDLIYTATMAVNKINRVRRQKFFRFLFWIIQIRIIWN